MLKSSYGFLATRHLQSYKIKLYKRNTIFLCTYYVFHLNLSQTFRIFKCLLLYDRLQRIEEVYVDDNEIHICSNQCYQDFIQDINADI